MIVDWHFINGVGMLFFSETRAEGAGGEAAALPGSDGRAAAKIRHVKRGCSIADAVSGTDDSKEIGIGGA